MYYEGATMTVGAVLLHITYVSGDPHANMTWADFFIL